MLKDTRKRGKQGPLSTPLFSAFMLGENNARFPVSPRKPRTLHVDYTHRVTYIFFDRLHETTWCQNETWNTALSRR